MFLACCECSKSLFFSCYQSKSHYHSSTEKRSILRLKLCSLLHSLSFLPSLHLSFWLSIFQKYGVRQENKLPLAESAGDSNVFYQGQRTPQFPASSPTLVITIAHFCALFAHSRSARLHCKICLYSCQK